MLERRQESLLPDPAVSIFRRGMLSDIAVPVTQTAMRIGLVVSALHGVIFYITNLKMTLG